jgi:hypothetical protein
MISKLATFLFCLTIATSGVVAAEEGVAPGAQPSMQPKLVRSKKTKSKEAAPPCPRGGQQKDASFCLDAKDINASPTRVESDGGRSVDNAKRPNLFLKGPDDNIISDPHIKEPIRSPKEPVGGSVGLRFRF